MTTEKALCKKLAISLAVLAAFSFSARAFDADTIAFYPLNEGTSGESAVGTGVALNCVDSSVCTADAATISTGEILWDGDRPGQYVFDGIDPLSRPVAVYTNPASIHITGSQGSVGGYISFNGLSGRFLKSIAENGMGTLEFFWRIPAGEAYRTWARGASLDGSFTVSGTEYTSLYLCLPTQVGHSDYERQVRLSYDGDFHGAYAFTPESHLGEWVHVAVVYTNGSFRIYNNYVETFGEFACSVANPVDPDSCAFRFGCGADTSSCGYRGKVSCVRLSAKALTPDKFLRCSDREHFYDEAVPKNVALDGHSIAFYPFDGAETGSSISDVKLINAVDFERNVGYLSSLSVGASVTFSDDSPGRYVFTNFSAGAVAVYTNPASIYFSGVPNASTGMKGNSGNILFADIGTELSGKAEGTIELFWKVCETNSMPNWSIVANWETGVSGCAGEFGLALPLYVSSRESDYAKIVSIMDGGAQSVSTRYLRYSYPRWLSDGLWHHVAVTYSNGFYRMYCDYRPAGIVSEQLLHTPQTGSKPLNFGKNAYNGYVSCIRVSDKALVPSEMLRVSNLPNCRNEDDAFFHWRFEDGTPGDGVYSVSNDCVSAFKAQNPQLYLWEREVAGAAYCENAGAPRPAYSTEAWKTAVRLGEGGAEMANTRSAHLVATTMGSGASFNSGWGLCAPAELLVDGSFTAEMFARLDYAAFKEHVMDVSSTRSRVTLMTHHISGYNFGAWTLAINNIDTTPILTLSRSAADATGTSASSAEMSSLTNGWHHYAVVHDATSQTMNVYVDRECVISWGLSYPLRAGEGDGYYFGCRGNNNFFDGCIDEIRVTKAALPPERFLFAKRKSSGMTLIFR